MPFTRLALVAVWLIVLGLFLLTASGSIAAKTGLLWLVMAGLVTPGIILTLTARLRRVPVLVVPAGVGPVVAAERPGEMRRDGDRE
jgi:hypothetical protein